MKLVTMVFMLTVMSQDKSSTIFEFNNTKSSSKWSVVDDRVMGGLSQGRLSINEAGNGLFQGDVTTENNGGFSSVRYAFNPKDVSKFTHVILKLKGDGKSYQFRIKENTSQRYSYIATFKTSGEWEVIKIPFNVFFPSFRGYQLDKPNFSGDVMEEIAFLIGNKTKESFALEIEKISLE